MAIIKKMVSVIVPTHNRADFLQQALSSIVNQSYPLIEIIVIANGCIDHTEHIVNVAKNSHHQPIIFLNFKQTLGGANARNIGLDKAQGEYIAFLDDDDCWHQNKLSTQIALLNQGNYAIVGSNFFYCYGVENKNKPAGRLSQSHIKLADLYYENVLGSFSFCLTKKTYIGQSRINEDLTALQDWDLWLKILNNTGLVACISSDYHVYFRLDGNRISNNYQKVIKAQKIFLHDWQDSLDGPSIRYHKMRITCLKIKLLNWGKFYHYVRHLHLIIKAVFSSPDKYNMKRYIHYLLLPIIDIDAFRAYILARIWHKFRSK